MNDAVYDPSKAVEQWQNHMIEQAKLDSDYLARELTAAITLERHAYEEYSRYKSEVDRLIDLIPKKQ